MKKIIFTLLAVTTLLVSSCKKESINPVEEIPEGAFIATVDENLAQNAPAVSNGKSTMTYIDGKKVYWSSYDEITVNGVEFSTGYEPGVEAVFTLADNQMSGPVRAPYYAFYPSSVYLGHNAYYQGKPNYGKLPTTQVFNTQKYANGKTLVTNIPLYAYSTTNRLQFRNIFAVMKIHIPANTTVSSIEIISDQVLNGEFRVNWTSANDTTGAVMVEQPNQYNTKDTIVPNSGATFNAASDSLVYVALPAQKYTNVVIKMHCNRGGSAGSDTTLVKHIASMDLKVNRLYNTRINFADEVFHFTARTNSAISMCKSGTNAPTVHLEYCTYTAATNDTSDWQRFTVGTTTVNLSTNDKIYFRAPKDSSNDFFCRIYLKQYNYFSIAGRVDVGGNIMYLLDNDASTTTLPKSGNWRKRGAEFGCLFENAPIADASKLILPVETLSICSYYYMFSGCTLLTSAPALPATNLEYECYEKMFMGCTRLTKAPALPATTMKNGCYRGMFAGCSSLTSAPDLPARTMEIYCYDSLFAGSGLTTAPALIATTAAEGCYQSMFSGCENLTGVVSIRLSTLEEYCCKEMFYGCSKLSDVNVYAISCSGYDCITSWLWLAGTDQSVTSRKVHCKSSMLDYIQEEIRHGTGDITTHVWTAVADL